MREALGNALQDMFIIRKDPNFLESNNVVIRVRQETCYGLNAFSTVFGNILESPERRIEIKWRLREIKKEQTSN